MMINYLFTGNIKIYKNGATVIVEAPTHGLKNVTFDGMILKVWGFFSKVTAFFPCSALAM